MFHSCLCCLIWFLQKCFTIILKGITVLWSLFTGAAGILAAVFSGIAICVAKRIHAQQQKTTLNEAYRSTEFGDSIRLISHWFTEKCGNKIENVSKEYTKLIKKQGNNYYRKNNCAWQKKFSLLELERARRLIGQYYWELNLFFKDKNISDEEKKDFANVFNTNELNLISIISRMNIAAEEKDEDPSKRKIYVDLYKKDGTVQPISDKHTSSKQRPNKRNIKNALDELYEYFDKNLKS